MIQNKMNEPILLGAEVIFKHIESESYLISSENCSLSRADSFRLELSSELCSAMIFKILPCNTFQCNG